MKATQDSQLRVAPKGMRKVDPLDILREALEVARESKPELNVDELIQFAIANPETEIVDSLGAVSIVCGQFGCYDPENLIPQRLLTHKNLSTLHGLTKVVEELNRRQGTP